MFAKACWWVTSIAVIAQCRAIRDFCARNPFISRRLRGGFPGTNQQALGGHVRFWTRFATGFARMNWRRVAVSKASRINADFADSLNQIWVRFPSPAPEWL